MVQSSPIWDTGNGDDTSFSYLDILPRSNTEIEVAALKTQDLMWEKIRSQVSCPCVNGDETTQTRLIILFGQTGNA